MALGASRERVVRMVLREGTVLAGIGMVLGIGGRLLCRPRHEQHALQRGLDRHFGILARWVPILLVSALVACYVPARRAAAVEPMRALRTE